MANKRIFTIGFELPGKEFEFIDASSTQTLLDADIVLFEPTLRHVSSSGTYNGKSVLNEDSSFRAKGQVDHWRAEITAAVNAGRLVIVFLVEPIEYYRYTGRRTHSGTGRSRVTTDHVTNISSYDAIPKLTNVSEKSGSAIRLERDAQLIATYWEEFSSISSYKVQIAGEFSVVLLKSKVGEIIVGAISRDGDGCLLFLPPLDYDEDKFTRFDKTKKTTYWTKEAMEFGKKLVKILVEMHNTIHEALA